MNPRTTTTGPDTQTDTRTPYRVTIVEKTYCTLDVLADSEDEALDIALEHSEAWVADDRRGGCDIEGVRECYAPDFSPFDA